MYCLHLGGTFSDLMYPCENICPARMLSERHDNDKNKSNFQYLLQMQFVYKQEQVWNPGQKRGNLNTWNAPQNENKGNGDPNLKPLVCIVEDSLYRSKTCYCMYKLSYSTTQNKIKLSLLVNVINW